VLSEQEEAEAIETVFGGDPVVADNYKQQATQIFQAALDVRVNRILDEARVLIEQIEQEQDDLQNIALDLLKDKIIERMTPRLSMTQREKLKSYAVSWEVDLLGADPFGEFGMKVEKFANEMFPRRVASPTWLDEPIGIDEYVIEAAEPRRAGCSLLSLAEWEGEVMEADRAINEILAGDSQQEKQSKRISHYESVKSELMGTLKKIDEEEQNASDEMTEMYGKYGIASWDFDTVFEFRDRRKKAWDDYGTFLQKEKASLDKAKQALMEQQENAEKLEKMKTVEGYLTVALDEWLSIQPVRRQMGTPDRPVKPAKRLNVLGDIADRVKRDMSEWKQKNVQRAKDHASGKDAGDYIETSRRKNNAIKSLYHKVTQR
jgi:hypothetical protein